MVKKIFLCVGIILAFMVLCVMGFSATNSNRYEIYMHPVMRADQYLLDKKTGQVWHLVENKDKTLLWEEMSKTYMQQYAE